MKFKKKHLKQAYLEGIRLGAKFSTKNEEPPSFKQWFSSLTMTCDHKGQWFYNHNTDSTYCSSCGVQVSVKNMMQ